MDKVMKEGIAEVQRLLAADQARQALSLVDTLYARADEEFQERELWRLDELCGACCHDLCDMEGAAGAYYQAGCHDRFLRSQVQHFSSYLFCLHYLSGMFPEEMRQQHFLYGNFFENIQPYQHRPKDKKRLRIGYLSPDFCTHAMADFIRPLFSCYDHQRYEVIGYPIGQTRDAVTEELRSRVDGWHDLSRLSFAEAAARIYADDIDLLVDLAGHSAGGATLMIAGYKPAAVQISGLGWVDTTGLEAIDYFLTDIFCDPPGEHDVDFCETLIRLPSTHLCYMPAHPLPVLPHDETRAGIIFGSFNNFSKVTDEMLSVWRDILERVPGARLVLRDTTALVSRQQAMAERLQEAGFALAEVELQMASPDYLEAYAAIDIALDTFPYPGGATTIEALLMGVPVLTLAGGRHSSRFGYSILCNAGLPELIAADRSSYVSLAVELAESPVRLRQLHTSLRQRVLASPLMDGPGYMKQMKKAYEVTWARWLQEGGN